MLHIVAICHVAIDISNRGKICPYTMKKRRSLLHVISKKSLFISKVFDMFTLQILV